MINLIVNYLMQCVFFCCFYFYLSFLAFQNSHLYRFQMCLLMLLLLSPFSRVQLCATP